MAVVPARMRVQQVRLSLLERMAALVVGISRVAWQSGRVSLETLPELLLLTSDVVGGCGS